MDKSGKKVTINDVAKYAGVGKATVSRVINNVEGVSPRTREKVLKAIEALNFSPSISARSLKTNETKQIALAISDIRNPHFPEVVWAADKTANKYGYRIIQINTSGNPREELNVIRQAEQMNIDGLIILPLAYPKELAIEIKKSNVPISVVHYGKKVDPNIQADIVSMHPQEGRIVMEHLIRLGKTRIGYVGGQKDRIEERYLTYEEALRESMIPYDPQLVYIGEEFSLQTGLDAAEYFSSLKQLPDAIYAANDMIAIGLLNRFRELEIKVPEDISVVGIDDIKWCVLTSPKLSTVSILGTETARIATELLIKRIKEKKVGNYERIQLEPTLIVRETSVAVNNKIIY